MSGAFLIGRRDDGKDIPVAVTDSGAVKVDIGGAEISIPGDISVTNVEAAWIRPFDLKPWLCKLKLF